MNGLRLDDYLPYRLSVASNAVSRLIARAYEDRFGLTIPQWRLIAVLAEDGPTVQAGLVARTRMDKVTVSRAAQGLARRGLVERAATADARSHTLALTPSGATLHAEIAPLALQFESELLGDLGEAEVEGLRRRLQQLEETAEALAIAHGSSRSVTAK